MRAVEREDQLRERGGLVFGIEGAPEGRELGGSGKFGDGAMRASVVV